MALRIISRALKKEAEMATAQIGGTDVLSASPFYRLVRDSLMMVLNMNRGSPLPPIDVLARQRRWVQGKLVEGAANDPTLSLEQKTALIDFHVKTLRDHFEDRRGAKRRASVLTLVSGN